MARRDRRGRPRGRSLGGVLFRWGPIVLVLALFAGAAAAYHYDLGTRWFGAAPDAASGVPPVPGLTLPPVPTPRAVAPAGARGPPRAAVGTPDPRPCPAGPTPGGPPRRRRPTDGSTGPRRRPRHVDAGLHPQAPHRHGRPRDPRPRPHLRDPGRRRRTQPPDPGRRWRPVPDRQATDRPRGARGRQSPDAGRGDRPQPQGPRGHHGLARLRHLAVHRAGAQPALAPELRHRQRGLPDHPALGRPGHRPRRRQSRGRSRRERCRPVRGLPAKGRRPRHADRSRRTRPRPRPARWHG